MCISHVSLHLQIVKNTRNQLFFHMPCRLVCSMHTSCGRATIENKTYENFTRQALPNLHEMLFSGNLNILRFGWSRVRFPEKISRKKRFPMRLKLIIRSWGKKKFFFNVAHNGLSKNWLLSTELIFNLEKKKTENSGKKILYP